MRRRLLELSKRPSGLFPMNFNRHVRSVRWVVATRRLTPIRRSLASSEKALQMWRLRQRLHPFVVAAIEIADRQRHQLGIWRIVQAGDVDRYEIAADFRHVAMAEGPDLPG